MRIGHAIIFAALLAGPAALLAGPAMADELVITTPNPGDAQRDLKAAGRAEQKAERAEERGNFGTAERQEQKAQRDLRDANRDMNDDTLKLKLGR
jgi:hypothetical protein